MAGLGFVIAELVSLSGQFWCWNLEIFYKMSRLFSFNILVQKASLSQRLLLLTHFWDTHQAEILFSLIFFTASIWSLKPGPTVVLGVFLLVQAAPMEAKLANVFRAFFSTFLRPAFGPGSLDQP